MFTSDPRVSVQTSGSNSWCLLIQNIQQADSGLYECVIGSDSHPLQRNTFHLKVEASHSNSPLLETNKRGKNKRRRELKPTSFSRLIADSYLYDSTEEEPSIVDITKLTVRSGKDAILQCTVENLGHHKVAWLLVKNQTLIAVHTKVILRSDRYSVSHENFRTWQLKIQNVTESDSGYYMCQINTPVFKTKPAYLEVVVPPSFDVGTTSNITSVTEYLQNVTLTCNATGHPVPLIKWCREDSRSFKLGDRQVELYGGTNLVFPWVNREHMGVYLCIATNNVQPSIRRRIPLEVNFPPTIWIPNQVVGAALHSNITLDCHLESYPKALSYWLRGKVLINDRENKYIKHVSHDSYKSHLKLTIINIEEKDYGPYKCAAKNDRGESEGVLTLHNPNDVLAPENYPPQLDKDIVVLMSGLEEQSEKNKGYRGNTVVHVSLASFFLVMLG
ncbi:lachesin-like isoform X2 [Tachypleus tridentatus]|uniref:lachesin-like isoform X2 n=1 Tax=Tachypleus tridentatus TaxID=6853 RepID=UPI003FCF4103